MQKLWHWILLWLVFTAVASFIFDVPKSLELTRTHRTTAGVVTHVSRNHLATTVRFTIDSVVYDQKFKAAGVRVGGPVLVRYYPGVPSYAMLDEPWPAAIEGIVFSLLGGMFLTAGMALWRWISFCVAKSVAGLNGRMEKDRNSAIREK